MVTPVGVRIIALQVQGHGEEKNSPRHNTSDQSFKDQRIYVGQTLCSGMKLISYYILYLHLHSTCDSYRSKVNHSKTTFYQKYTLLIHIL